MRSTDGDIVDMFLERNEEAINATSESTDGAFEILLFG